MLYGADMSSDQASFMMPYKAKLNYNDMDSPFTVVHENGPDDVA